MDLDDFAPPAEDRRIEHLVPSDLAIIRTRQMLLDGVRRVQRGEDPPCLSPSNTEGITAIDCFLPRGEPWASAVPAHVEVEEPRRKAAA